MSSEEALSESPTAPSSVGAGPSSRPLSRLEVIRALRISNLEAIAATVHASLTGGAFQTGFALLLGASSFWMGIIGAVPTISALIQIFSSVWVERIGERKGLTAWFSLVSRGLWLPILLIPWVLPREWWLGAFLVLFVVSSLALQVPVPAFTSWLSDLVPADHRGRYFGRRNMLAGLTTIAATIPPAWLMDRAVSEWGAPREAMFALLFGCAVVFGVVSFLLLLRQPEPPMVVEPAARTASVKAIVSLYRKPLADPMFRPFLMFSAAFAVGQFIAAPFYTVYALENLNLGYTWLQVLGGIASLSALLTMPVWGYLADRVGNKPLLVLAVVGVSLTPLPWLLCHPEHRTVTVVILAVNNLFGGIVWAGAGLLGFNMLIETSPSEGRSVYVGALSAASGLAGGIAPVLGGLALELYRVLPVQSWGVPINGYQAIFAANAVLRLLTLFFLVKVPSPARATPRQVLGQLGAIRVGTLRQMRRLQHGSDERAREEAVTRLSEARVGLAVQELVLALGDPSLRVRQRAAQALGEIGDKMAVPALLTALRQPESGIVREAAEALGRIGSADALPALGEVAVHGARSARLAALAALGRIGSAAAEPYLLSALDRAMENGEEDVAEAAVQAIGLCRIEAAQPRLVQMLDFVQPPLLLIVIRTLGELGDPTAAPALEDVLHRAVDPAVVTAACVALAQCGHTDAVGQMYEALSTVASATGRRQIANAIGSLLGGDQVYRWLTADPMEREATIARAIQNLGRGEKWVGRLVRHRRKALAQRAVQCYLNGDLRGAAQLLVRVGPHPDGPAGTVLDLARVRLREREPSEEEFLVVLAAAVLSGRADGEGRS